MIRHTQTILADPDRGDGHDAEGRPGDCFRTAIACLMDLPVLSVPHFAEYGEDEWWALTRLWVSGRGYDIGYGRVGTPWLTRLLEVAVGDYVVLGGMSPRGLFGHVVIGTRDLEFVHDPHPSQAGLVQVEEAFVLVKELPTD